MSTSGKTTNYHVTELRFPLRIVRNELRGGTAPTLDIKERAFIERLVARDALKFGFIVWLCVRVALSVWGIIIMSVAPPDSHAHVLRDYPDVVLPDRTLEGYTVGIWNIYDARHYVKIADDGYGSDPGYLTAFFPGFPLLIKLLTPLAFGQSLLAAILVANLSALVFFWFLYRLVEADYGESVAKRAVILSAVFPTSFFLFMPYTEAPLLAFTVAALYYGRQHKWWLAGLLAGCAALVKQPGVFLILPLGYMYWRQYLAYAKSPRFLRKFHWIWLLICPLAAFSYTLYRYLFINTPISGLTDLGAAEMIDFPGVPLFRAFAAVRPDNPLLVANLMEIGFTLLMIVLVTLTVLKMRSGTYGLYMIILAVVSLCVTWPNTLRPEADMPRRMLIIFPLFIYLALITENRRVFRLVAYTSAALFLSLSGLFVNWIFIS